MKFKKLKTKDVFEFLSNQPDSSNKGAETDPFKPLEIEEDKYLESEAMKEEHANEHQNPPGR